MNDAEHLIDLSAPRHYEQVTPRGRRRRRVAIAGLAAIAVALTGGAGYAVVQRAAQGPAVPAVAPSSGPPAAREAARAPGRKPAPGLDPVRASPTG